MSYSQNVTVKEMTGPEYILLTPGTYLPRTGDNHGLLFVGNAIDTYPTKFLELLDSMTRSEFVAVDFETMGADYTDKNQRIVGIGLAWDTGSMYIDWLSSPLNMLDKILDALAVHKGLLAHNVYFDGGVLQNALSGYYAPWHTCTYALLSMLHNESMESKSGLKTAQVELLGWENANDEDLSEWLCANGYYTGVKRVSTDPDLLIQLYREKKIRPEKGQMWRAPQDILGKYCHLDAEACYLLYTMLLRPKLQEYPSMQVWFERDFMHLIKQHIIQKQAGILMDRTSLLRYKAELEADIDLITQDFLSLPEVAEPIRKIEDRLRAKQRAKEVKQFNADGSVSKVYTKFMDKNNRMEAGEFPEFNFNIQSALQLRELLYEHMKFPVLIMTDNEDTPSPAVSAKALAKMGVVGEILIERSDRVKTLSFVDGYLDLIKDRDTVHPSFRMPGTITGRLSGRDPNLQQLPKTYSMMSTLVARPGHVFIDLDFASLEPTVTTELSGDKNMEMIYGNNASPYQDFYLFVGASIPGIREKLIAAGYDPENPTKEGTANAKKVCKLERNACKVTALACAYGSGAKNVHQKLEEQNIFLSLDEVFTIHTGYWDLFSQVKDYGRSLYFEWKRNKGFVMNATGRPMACPEKYNKDLLNRVIQSSGHDILVTYIRILCDEFDLQGIPYTPIIIDLHDASTVEVPEEFQEKGLEVFRIAMRKLNEELGGTIKLKGTPMAGKNIAVVKEAAE